MGIDSWRGEVEEDGQKESNGSPNTAEYTTVSPIRIRSDQLRPEDGRAERQDCENEKCDIGSALSGRCKFGGHSESREFVDTSARAGYGHAPCECLEP